MDSCAELKGPNGQDGMNGFAPSGGSFTYDCVNRTLTLNIIQGDQTFTATAIFPAPAP